MLVFGFQGTHIGDDPSLCDTIRRDALGGVILFGKNLRTLPQTARLTAGLQALNRDTLLIAIDEEGGRVDRLAKLKTIPPTPSAREMAHLPPQKRERLWRAMAANLKRLGFNLNFAPVVDLAINPQNPVIVKKGRAFGNDPGQVAQLAKSFIRIHHAAGLLTTLKHFPGHGSSRSDSHKGFTDVTRTWHATELAPFQKLIDAGCVDLIMSAHIFNAKLDPRKPATLSSKVLTGLLRERLHYDRVIVTDDLQMGAITQNYSLEEAIAGAIDAGADLLLFGNQLAHPVTADRVIDIIASLLASGRIEAAAIHRANARIRSLKARLNGTVQRKK